MMAALKFIGNRAAAPGSKVYPINTHGSAVAPGAGQSSSSVKFAKTGREVDPAGSNLLSFLIPLAAWGLLVVVSFSLTLWQFEETGAPTISLGVAARVESLATVARFYANDLVLLGTESHVRLGNRTVEDAVSYTHLTLPTILLV